MILVGVLALASIGAVAWAAAQPPTNTEPTKDTEAEALPQLPVPPEPAAPWVEYASPYPPTPNQPADVKSDPLFQEIQRMILKGNTGAATTDKTQQESHASSISQAKWHAVESILAAARVLEADVADSVQHQALDQAAHTQAIIQNLRIQALELLKK